MSKLGAYNLSSGSGFQKSRAEAAFLNPKPSKKNTHQTSQFIQLHGVVSRSLKIFGWHLDIRIPLGLFLEGKKNG